MSIITALKGRIMAATTRISPKHQITIPQPVFDQAGLEPGDVLEVTFERGRIIFTPKRLADKIPAAKLTAHEQKVLARAQEKINKINTDVLNSTGLTTAEIAVAAKAGLIDPEQAYFWTEEWQRDLREAERDIQEGRVSPAFDTIKDALAHLHREASKV